MQLKVQVTGALSHGHGLYVFLQYGQYPSDKHATLIDDRCLDQVPGRDIASTKSAICADG